MQRSHLPEYAIEGALLGLFMASACGFTLLLEHPASPVRQAVADPWWRRLLAGAAMGLTAMALIYSPWGRRSGAHMNPSLTVTFLRLGKVAAGDAAGYVVAQFIGGALGVLLVALAAGMALAHPAVHFAATVPGAAGAGAAFAGELVISFAMMAMVLVTSNTPTLAPWTGVCAGVLVGVCIWFEAPLSGMSMNPARTFASALVAGDWRGAWVYFVAPPLGMLAAAEAYVRVRGRHRVGCAKLRHGRAARCIFRCNDRQLGEAA
ncbi:MAG: aquaporin [Candidatus Binatia bacterium]